MLQARETKAVGSSGGATVPVMEPAQVREGDDLPLLDRPVQPEPLPVPLRYRVRLHDEQRSLPVGPKP